MGWFGNKVPEEWMIAEHAYQASLATNNSSALAQLKFEDARLPAVAHMLELRYKELIVVYRERINWNPVLLMALQFPPSELLKRVFDINLQLWSPLILGLDHSRNAEAVLEVLDSRWATYAAAARLLQSTQKSEFSPSELALAARYPTETIIDPAKVFKLKIGPDGAVTMSVS